MVLLNQLERQPGMNINPCKECIVTSMCRDLCNNLCEYLNAYLPNFPDHGKYKNRTVADALRKGIIELCDNEKGWRYIGRWTNYEKD